MTSSSTKRHATRHLQGPEAHQRCLKGPVNKGLMLNGKRLLSAVKNQQVVLMLTFKHHFWVVWCILCCWDLWLYCCMLSVCSSIQLVTSYERWISSGAYMAVIFVFLCVTVSVFRYCYSTYWCLVESNSSSCRWLIDSFKYSYRIFALSSCFQSLTRSRRLNSSLCQAVLGQRGSWRKARKVAAFVALLLGESWQYRQ